MKIINEYQDEHATHAAPTDDIVEGPILQIMVAGQWILVTDEIWDSWTGLRRKNGEEHHGPIMPLFERDKTYTGGRVCPCKICQASVEGKHRPN